MFFVKPNASDRIFICAIIVLVWAACMCIIEALVVDGSCGGIPLIYSYEATPTEMTVHPFKEYFKEVCINSSELLKEEWQIDNICPADSWVDFSSIGNFNDEDFKLWGPRHLIKVDNGSWIEESPVDYISIPRDFCVFSTQGWFVYSGTVFNCHNQYPLIIRQDRPDLHRHNHIPSLQEVYINEGPLYSGLFVFSEAFSHTLTSGVGIGIFLLAMMQKNPYSKLLVPQRGPFASILNATGIPSHRIIAVHDSSSSRVTYFSKEATLLLRRPEFNILQAHWPARSLSSMRNRTVQWLEDNNYIGREPSNWVVYLSRSRGEGERRVAREDLLLHAINESLREGFVLKVLDEHIRYNEHRQSEAWITTASYFTRAAAVIGPHGGAFGNTFLCSWNSTIIEFNLPWSTKLAADTGPKVRDLFYSTARGIGNFRYYFVNPKNAYHSLGDFYSSKDHVIIDTEEVIAILRANGIAKVS